MGVPVTSHDHGDLMAIFTDSAEGSLDQAWGRDVCFPVKSGVDPSKAEIFQRCFVMNMSLRKEQVCHLHVFFGWKKLEDQSVGSVFFGQHEITRITRISKGIFQKAGLTIQDFTEI